MAKKQKFTFIDLFAGIGGMRIAYERAGGKCVYSSEWNKYSQQTYKANFGDGITRTLSARYYKDGSEILIEQEGKNPRRLTPRECARLQGFPEDFVIPVSDHGLRQQDLEGCLGDLLDEEWDKIKC